MIRVQPAQRETSAPTLSMARHIVLEWREPGPYFDAEPVAHCATFAPDGDVMTENIVQLEIFPEPRYIEVIDPRAAIGPDTRVSALYRVRYGEARVVHDVYHDRHGWYCAEHGPKCLAVGDAVDVAASR
jgi:hypothetical protein